MKTITHFLINTQPTSTFLKITSIKAILFCLWMVLAQSNLFCETTGYCNGKSKEIKNNRSKWKAVSINSELEVYERWIYLPENRKTRERKGIFYVTNEVDDILEMTSEANGIKLWMAGVKESEDLFSNDLNKRMMYIFFNVPWPFSDKDLVAEITISNKTSPQTTTIHYSAVSDYLPLNSEAERLLSYEATWTITTLESGLTQVVFTVFSDTPPVAPRWIQDPITIKLFKKNLLKLRDLLIQRDNMELNVMNK